ncbi:MAG TPA: PAS domain-containing protein [candidate division Zixibacteria bacterium]|nr:PAS domain-containing protein [candidate division Zixibacteria bacterium]
MDNTKKVTLTRPENTEDISRFTDSYAAFNRVINSLQRQYIELKDEFSAQNEQLARANQRLVELSERNLVATEFLNGILNSLSAGVIAVDRDGCITHFNPAAAAILQIGQAAVLGKSYRKTIPLGNAPKASALRATETGETVDSVERQVVLTNGRSVHLSVSTTLMRDAEGQLSGAVEVLHDLTRVKRMESELARLNTLAALGEMAATIAHEVRNPLNGIAGFAALLQRDLDEEDSRHKTATKIVKGVETLNKTVSTLLNYTRFEEINKTYLDMRKFLVDTVDRYTAENRGKIGDVSFEVDRSVNNESLSLQFDPILIKQAVINLLQNAVQAIKGEGVVGLEVKRWSVIEARRELGERLLLDNDETVVEVIVHDSGPGIKREYRERVFSPFFSIRKGGNGLGLAVVWKVVKAHGGEVFVDDGPLGGAAFHLLLPARCDSVSMEQTK